MAGVFGLRGELKLDPSRIGDDALAVGLTLRATLRDGTTRELRIASLRPHKGRPLVRFDGIDDATAAQPLVGATLAIPRSAVVLKRDEYLDDDLRGCALVDASGAILGDVTAVEHYPAQDVLIVRVAGASPRTAMVPLVRTFVQQIDVTAKRIAVDLPRGLLDERDADQA
ncbi:ribosome maturation factor RimM [Vulcanimicrobium alpinum]|uniref:Ribosome maturation factor RimM n=1 Tax=Vulcanimicrobium alpinum TaxID=3016050 RepID=A0AAN1XWH3_UNVUL|nr:ribosome maturation factor RimM [Vulcanimicrobium alpinum]BDE06649.1 ribosome maturation factor RimM [Vulcanimicrobium alpinum]